jgi:hypothetical protein
VNNFLITGPKVGWSQLLFLLFRDSKGTILVKEERRGGDSARPLTQKPEIVS